jgi:hypothetical protein
MKTDRGDRAAPVRLAFRSSGRPGGALGLGANRAEIDSELLAFRVEMAALEAQHLRRIGHVMMLPPELGEKRFTLELFHPCG